LTGTLLNTVAVLVGGGLGLIFGARLSERLRGTVLAALGLFVAGLGLQMFLETQSPLVDVASLLIGAVIGEALRIEDRLDALGGWLEARWSGSESEAAEGRNFVRGFVTASLLFCVGPLSIVGPIQDGLLGDYHLLAVKSLLDAFSSLAFASTLGVGVLFSSIIVLTYQGSIALLAAQAQAVLTQPMMTELTAVGGLIILGLAISSLLELRRIRTSNLLPALVIAPLLVQIVAWLSPFFRGLGLG
jgi:uncharacterized membrane protein YqgA involved in biofilm formation